MNSKEKNELILHTLGEVKSKVCAVSVLESPDEAKWEFVGGDLKVSYTYPDCTVALPVIKIILKE